MFLYSKAEVYEMWKRPKELQYSIAQEKCIEAITVTKGNLAVSFSGGKDSAVLLFIMAQAWSMIYPDKELIVFFINTGNEFNCADKYRKNFLYWIETEFNVKINYFEVSAGTSFFSVVDKVGLPFISKRVSKMIRLCNTDLKRLGVSYSEIESIFPEHSTVHFGNEMFIAAYQLRKIGFSQEVISFFTKINKNNQFMKNTLYFLPFKFRALLKEDGINFSEKCCEYLKEIPLLQLHQRLGGLLPVTGEMASDGFQRMEAYRKTGCNVFYGKSRKSKPLGAMTEQTILWLIHRYRIPIMPVYGKCSYCIKDGKEVYMMTGQQRTGCKLCGFGIQYDPDKFMKLYKIEPEVVKFAFTSQENGGLDYRKICSILNEKCGFKIGIPPVKDGHY